MKIRIQREDKWSYFYLILVIFCFLSIWFSTFKVGVFFAFVMLIYMVKNFSLLSKLDHNDFFVLLYVGWSALSIIWAIQNSGIQNYIYALVYSVMPVCFFFYARDLSMEKADKVKRVIISTIAWSMSLGFIFYLLAPRFYSDFLYNRLYIPNTTLYQVRKMFHGVFGVTVTASLCAIWGLDEWHKFVKEPKSNWSVLIFSFVLLLLTARKSAILVLLLIIAIESYGQFVSNKRIRNRIVIGIFVAVSGILLLIQLFPNQFNETINRFTLENFRIGISVRNTANLQALNNLEDIIIGNGLGSSGHRAGMAESLRVSIFDNSYMLILCEVGIIGLFLFIFMLLFGIKSALQKIDICKYEFEVLAILSIQSLASNMFEFIYIMPIFWYCLGRCFGSYNR